MLEPRDLKVSDSEVESVLTQINDDEDRVDAFASMAWSIVCEPGDGTAGLLVKTFGAAEALKLELDQVAPSRIVDKLMEQNAIDPSKSNYWQERVNDGRERWKPRLNFASVLTAANTLRYLNGTLLTNQSRLWPKQINDLAEDDKSFQPHALWVRGKVSSLPLTGRSLGVVGSRTATSYGEFVTPDLIAGPVSRNYSVISGGAYGIDSIAHRATLALDGVTFSVMAGGIDEFYPSANNQLFDQIMQNGAMISEVAPGSAPTKWRFLQRNRLIAALSNAVLLVEAGHRSGAQNTATHAHNLNRPIGVVPGPITSPASAGCHKLIREGVAQLITDSTDLFDLLGEPIEWQSVAQLTGLGPLEIRTLDAIGFGNLDVDKICRSAGLTQKEVRIALSSLELDKLVVRTNTGWSRSQTTV